MVTKSDEYLPAVIREKGLPVIKTNQELIEKVHNVLTPDKFVVLVPKVMNIGENVKIAIHIEDTDETKDLKKNRDFWGFPDSADAIMSANLINRLTAKANCRFTPKFTGIVDSKYDKEERPIRLRAQAHCTTLDPLGNVREGFGEYEWNYNEDRANKSLKPFQVEQRRRFAVQMAITGAKKRAFFECLGINKSISRSDIGKAFVVPCVLDDTDYDDPFVKRAIALKRIGAEQEIFGPDKRIQAEATFEDEGKNNEQPKKAPKTESEETEAAPEEHPKGPPEDPPEAKEERPTPAQLRDSYKDEWENASGDERSKKIRSLAEKIGHDVTKRRDGKNAIPPEKWNPEVQVNWILWLGEQAGEIPPEPKGGE